MNNKNEYTSAILPNARDQHLRRNMLVNLGSLFAQLIKILHCSRKLDDSNELLMIAQPANERSASATSSTRNSSFSSLMLSPFKPNQFSCVRNA